MDRETFLREHFNEQWWSDLITTKWVPYTTGETLPPSLCHADYYLAPRYEEQRRTRRFVHESLPVWIGDVVTDHVQRAVGMAKAIPSGLFHLSTITAASNALKLHDIHEQGEQDETAVALHYRLRNKKVSEEAAEQWLAMSLLGPNFTHRGRWLKFRAAELFLKGTGDYHSYITLPYILASIIDTVEGNLTFHYRVTRWLLQYEGMPVDRHFPDPWLHYTFAINQNFKNQLAKTPWPQAQPLMAMLDAVEQTALGWWRKVPEHNIPDAICGYLAR